MVRGALDPEKDRAIGDGSEGHTGCPPTLTSPACPTETDFQVTSGPRAHNNRKVTHVLPFSYAAVTGGTGGRLELFATALNRATE